MTGWVNDRTEGGERADGETLLKSLTGHEEASDSSGEMTLLQSKRRRLTPARTH